MYHDRLARTPICLTLPGLDGSDGDHWQTLWERARPGMQRVDLGNWSSPSRNLWISRLERALANARGPAVLIAHGLSCHLVAWWAQVAGEAASRPVAGAMLVAPPDLDRVRGDSRVAGFAPTPRGVLPFPTVVVASRDDPACTPARSREMAGNWLGAFYDVGGGGHLGARSGLGDWREGQGVLDGLLDHVCARGDRRMDDQIVRERPELIARVPA